MYYKIVGESQNSYARYIFLNEMVAGQDIDYINNLIIHEKEEPLRFDEENCYICLLGLKKAVYSDNYGLTTNQYMQIYVQFEKQMLELFEKHGLKGEIFLHLYADKQIIIIYSKDSTSTLKSYQIVEYAQDCLQLLYGNNFLDDNVYCNQTYYNEEMINRLNLSSAFKNLLQLSKLNYFYMEPVVITNKLIKKLYKKCNESDIRELKQQISQSISAGNYEKYKVVLDELMLNKIKYSFDFYLLDDIGLFFKQLYLECCSAYGIPINENINYFFDYRKYPKIEIFTKKLSIKFKECVDYVNLREKKYSQLIQKSLRILNTSFYKLDVSASYVASQVNVSPAYLSSVFNREVEMSISQYLTELRIKRAKELLQETSLLISDISLSVGYSNRRYFSQVFKEKVGCTPKQYRDSLINDSINSI